MSLGSGNVVKIVFEYPIKVTYLYVKLFQSIVLHSYKRKANTVKTDLSNGHSYCAKVLYCLAFKETVLSSLLI